MESNGLDLYSTRFLPDADRLDVIRGNSCRVEGIVGTLKNLALELNLEG